jgi:serine/threonine-protein kinase ATR
LRQGDFTPAAFNAILHATQLGDGASKIEYSKMLWKEGHHRKAIQNIRGAIKSNSFQTRDLQSVDVSVSVSTTGLATDGPQAQNRVKAHAQMLLAKWLDRAGQTQSTVLKEEYSRGIMMYPKWDKGHYYLGRYYLKLYETEKALPPAKQAQNFLAGELTKLVIENYTRSTVYGAKHYYQTIPKLLTLWLDMGNEVMNSQPRLPRDKDLHQHKVNHLDYINKYLKRYTNERMPAYPWYTALPQMITRISHPDKSVWEILQFIILKVAGQYPQQALWGLFAVLHSTQDGRRSRGTTTLQKLRVSNSDDRAGQAHHSTKANKKKDHGKRKNLAGNIDLKTLILQGQRLTDALLLACDAHVEPRTTTVSLSRDLGFKMTLLPCALVVPIEATMAATLPSSNESRAIRAHNPFPSETITISEIKDSVLVLSSLQRPRKLVAVGSDGKSYGLMCKPKDDLRKDQRLMEFNAMINRAFQRDTASTKRRLYIKTYGVTPLNEECGAIEWVEGLKPMRDIILRLYRQKNVGIDYGEIKLLLQEAASSPSKTPIFTHKILKKFQPVLHEWFVETFPEPETWFAARLRYMRSCAVMSIVGHVLGLGDRHGENILLEEGNGGTFHVDFNCLFDKGLTFEKPELVPFRLTHNMVDAMGPSGIEGPFRASCEITYSLLRQHLDTLITILETFVHDPTTDFVGQRKKKRIPGVPETPKEVLEMVRGKVEGEVRGESLKLSVEGYVGWLVGMAVDPGRLAGMYIGWCAFF